MPAEIVALGLERIRRAVVFVEQFENVTPCVSSGVVGGPPVETSEDSMAEWDKQSEF
jgi:hypothetical protein